jgi:hypothetical protein
MRMTPCSDRTVAELVAAHGGEIVGHRPDQRYTRDWHCTRYVLRRR